MQRRLSPRADWAPPRSGTAGRCQATSKTDPPRFPCRWRGPRAARLADTVRGRHEAGRLRHRRCCGEHREGMTAMAHRRRIASAPPASWSPACRRRAPYRRWALWTCPAYGRPVRNGLHPQSGDTGAHSPLEISRATAGDRAGAEAARFPQVHSASLWIYSHGKPRHELNPKALTCPQNRGNLTHTTMSDNRLVGPSGARPAPNPFSTRRFGRLTGADHRPASGSFLNWK